MEIAEFRAMGTRVRLGAVGGSRRVLDDARHLVLACEERWSRFRPESELSRINRGAGRRTLVTFDTFALVEAAVDAWCLTAGRFDPTVLPALIAAGYDRTFEEVPTDIGRRRPPCPAPGCAGIELDRGLGMVTLPPGVTLDLGGLAKGHTADLVTAAMREAGAAGAMADLGGDVRVTGEPPAASTAWEVGIDAPHRPGLELFRVRLADGAVVTSSALRRSWTAAGQRMHHLIDPLTGAPAHRGVAAAVVIGAEAASAEVVAKAAVVAGREDGAEMARAFDVTGLLVGDDGTVHVLEGFEAFAS